MTEAAQSPGSTAARPDRVPGQAWIVRAGRDDEYERAAFAHGVVAIGWRRVGDLFPARSLRAVRERTEEVYPSVAPHTRETYAVQLHAFRSGMRRGDPVVLLRENAPDVAVGEIVGDYRHFPAGAGQPSHVRSVRWSRERVGRSEFGAALLMAPALTAVYRLTNADAVQRIRKVAKVTSTDTPSAGEAGPQEPDGPAPVGALPAPPLVEPPSRRWTPAGGRSAAANLSRNLSYALSLAEAGSNLERLGVTRFEVTDVYRAAWVQAVAALDHWVHQEVRERMLALCEQPASPKTSQYDAVTLPLGVVEQVRQGRMPLREAVDAHYLQGEFAFRTFQQPDTIRQAFRQVSDVDRLWRQVATTLSERAGGSTTWSEKDVVDRLRRVVNRRNRIAHEYDDDPGEPSGKRPIDGTETMHTIRWIEQVAAAILEVVGP